MANIGKIFRRSVHGINHFEMSGAGIEPFAVNYKVLVISNANFFIGHADQSFNIKLILVRDSYNPLRFEYYDLPSLWMAKVIGHSVHQQMVASDDSELQNILALFVSLVIAQLTKLFHAVLRRKPNRQLFAVELNDLTLHERENSLRRIDHRNFPIFRSNEMFIGNAV